MDCNGSYHPMRRSLFWTLGRRVQAAFARCLVVGTSSTVTFERVSYCDSHRAYDSLLSDFGGHR